jgi:carbon-monoxide dehydrogenase medium subunit
VKPGPFAYHAPTTVAEAVALLHDLGDDAKVIAGGQSLVPMLAMRLAQFDHLVDVGRIADLRGVEWRNGSVRVRAATPDVAIERDRDVGRDVPLLAMVTPMIGHFQIRNRGTVGGSIAHADPAAEYPAVALALDAEIEVASAAGTRAVPASEFFTGTWSTALEPDELVTAVQFPVWTGRCGFGAKEFARRHGDFAIAGAVAGVELDRDGAIVRCAIAMFGLGSTPLRARAAEAALVGAGAGGGGAAAISPQDVGRLALADVFEPADDIHAPARYRLRVGAAMVEGAWRQAVKEAEHS